jgi:hypothetical protein
MKLLRLGPNYTTACRISGRPCRSCSVTDGVCYPANRKLSPVFVVCHRASAAMVLAIQEAKR